MKRHKKIVLILLSLIMILIINAPVYATTCKLTINDDGEKNGFKKLGDQLYYVVTVSSKILAGNVSSINFKICYDEKNLELLKLEKGEELDLGEKGKFNEYGRICLFEPENEELKEYWLDDGSSEIGPTYYLGGSKKTDEIVPVKETEMDLVKFCFKVTDNKEEKRLVYIDTGSTETMAGGAYMSPKERYVTNGLPMPEEIINKDKEDEPGTTPGTNPGANDGNNNQGTNDQNNNSGTSNKGDNTDEEKDITTKPATKDDSLSPNKLPFTGLGRILIIAVVIIGIITFILRNKLNKMKDVS